MARAKQSAALLRQDDYALAVVRDPLELARLRTDWSALMEESDAAIFNAWDWLYPWLCRLGQHTEPYVLTARDRSGRLVGLMPLGRRLRHVAGRAVRTLAFLGDTTVGSDYLDAVATRGRRAEVMRAFVRLLADLDDQWDLLELNDLDERSTTPQLLGETFVSETYELRTRERSLCPNETFEDGETFDRFLRRTRRRDNYLRRKKWLERQPGYRIEIDSDPRKLTRPLAEFFRLHALRWAEEGGSQGIASPKVEAFHRDATALLAERGKLRLYTMWLEDRALASVYGIVHGDTFHYYQAGYDPEWRNKSVGLVLVGATFEDAIAQGLKHYDFLRGTEPYKSDWVSKERRTIQVRLFARKGVGALYVKAEDAAREVRGMAKRLLPAPAMEALRRVRRQARSA